MNTPGTRHRFWLGLLNRSPLVFFVLVAIGFSLASDRFCSLENVENILIQSAYVGILAVGMTFVLLLGRVDLSVGSVMFVAGAACGKLLEIETPFIFALGAMVVVALGFGALNAFFILRFRIVSFIVTLSTLYVGRGFGHWMTQTRPTPVRPFEALGSAEVLGLQAPIIVFGIVVLVAHLVLRHTAFGRQLYAVGGDIEASRRAGVPVIRLTASAFLISALCAGVAAMVALSQSPTVSPEFGAELEFTAIAAAVIGGTSLFGGKGQVFPGAVLGAVLLQMVENGLNILNVDPYLYPLILSGIIFLAVLTDSQRHQLLSRLHRRRIRLEPGEVSPSEQ